MTIMYATRPLLDWVAHVCGDPCHDSILMGHKLVVYVVALLVDVSKNRSTPKSSILIGFSIINHPFWDTTIFGNTFVVVVVLLLILVVVVVIALLLLLLLLVPIFSGQRGPLRYLPQELGHRTSNLHQLEQADCPDHLLIEPRSSIM